MGVTGRMEIQQSTWFHHVQESNGLDYVGAIAADSIDLTTL